MRTTKKILFLTGTRADFGKLKPLIAEVASSSEFSYGIFATGMHMLARYGATLKEIYDSGFHNIFPFINQDGALNTGMDLALANTVQGFGHYLRENPCDLIVVHGDRIEALAGAIVGALNNALVAHIEGGEVSGTVDELLRHSISKLAHLHFVANSEARCRLIQMGELPDAIQVIGSPDIDVMLSNRLPSIADVKNRYGISFARYCIFMLHPVTTELHRLERDVRAVLDALNASGLNFIAIYPNNDTGSDKILSALRQMEGNPRFRVLPSMRFEFFLTLLKNATAIVGNSSAGIREAPVSCVPTVNIGSRQSHRFNYPSILNVPAKKEAVCEALKQLPHSFPPALHFGTGDSAPLFMKAIRSSNLWAISRQKRFRDVAVTDPQEHVSQVGK